MNKGLTSILCRPVPIQHAVKTPVLDSPLYQQLVEYLRQQASRPPVPLFTWLERPTDDINSSGSGEGGPDTCCYIKYSTCHRGTFVCDVIERAADLPASCRYAPGHRFIQSPRCLTLHSQFIICDYRPHDVPLVGSHSTKFDMLPLFDQHVRSPE